MWKRLRLVWQDADNTWINQLTTFAGWLNFHSDQM
jgi:hypothetical protein